MLRKAPTQCGPSSCTVAQLEKLRTDLLQLNRPCCLSQLLQPPVQVALRDHNYMYTASGVCRVLPPPVTDHTVVEKQRLCPCA